MGSEPDRFSRFPREVRSGTRRSSPVHARLPDHYALYRAQSDRAASPDALLSMVDEDEVIEVFRGEPDEHKADRSARVGPVYALQPGGSLTVPTGRVFVRLKEGVSLDERLEEIAEAGYELERRIEFAPHTGWLRPRSGEIADALTGIPRLERIAGFENVEPQMLMQRSLR